MKTEDEVHQAIAAVSAKRDHFLAVYDATLAVSADLVIDALEWIVGTRSEGADRFGELVANHVKAKQQIERHQDN